jgi:hypothetical protein
MLPLAGCVVVEKHRAREPEAKYATLPKQLPKLINDSRML